ncbi:MAG TPA: hypothetical protein VFV38_33855 [Ktedonobacteraceae bacterium]|nr:hypothetical protein [Ktedonobacteraceae bacterium]
MPEYIYPWKRFWCPRETPIEKIDGGYLYRPEEEWTNHLFDGHLIPLPELASVPCLILLGEPGLGKSWELRQQYTLTRDHLGEAALWCDLSAYQEQSMLVRDLFDDATFQKWVRGIHHLHLFLDSLDEGLLSIPVLTRFLSSEFARSRDHLARLFLRITCRTAEWPALLEEQLRDLWGSTNVQTFRLAPLRREDVRIAAIVQGVDADQFLAEVDHNVAIPLAHRPITLNLLLKRYREYSTFPLTQQALYEEGCRLLCREINPSRRIAGFTGRFTDQQRLAAAARLAYLMVFTNHNEVWDDDNLGDSPSGSLQLSECSGGTEDVEGNSLPVNETLLAEACATALFSSRGPDRREWAHRTYAEYLAAYYLSHHQLSLPQLMMLLLHADTSERRLIPQLHETAAWLATMQPAVFQAIMEIDPEVVLQSDVTMASEQARANLVTVLLALEPEERLWKVNMNLGQHYHKLLYSGIDAQLAAVISDRDCGVTRRVVAIEIAEACRLQALSSELVALALDTSEERLVREASAQAVAEMGNDASKASLKPLVLEQHEDDPDDELKGHSLRAVWPAHMTVEELFAALTPPKRHDFIGAYYIFLSSEIAPSLGPADLPVALQWVEQHPPRATMQGLTGELKPLTDAIIRLALEHLDEPGILAAVAQLILSRLLQSGLIFGLTPDEHETARWLDNDKVRHQLLEIALPMLAQHTNDGIVWHVAQPPLLLPRDLPWLLTILAETPEEATQQLIARLVGRLIDSNDPTQVQTALEASEQLFTLADEAAWIFRPVALDSSEAIQMQRAWRAWLQAASSQEPDQLPSPQTPPPLESIEVLLNTFEQGEYGAWFSLSQRLMSMPGGEAPRNIQGNLMAYGAWHVLEEPLQVRVVEAAKRYIWNERPEPQVGSDLDLIDYFPLALLTYQALYLVFQKEPAFLATLPQEAWTRLVPAILTAGLFLPDAPGEESNRVAQRRLVVAAHRYAPAELIVGIMQLLEKDQWNCTSSYWTLLRNVEEVWSTALADALLAKASERTLAPECSSSLLSILLVHHVKAAKEYALMLLALPLPVDDRERQYTLNAAFALVRFDDEAGWSAVWPAIGSDRAFGTKLIAGMAYWDWDAHQLTEEQLADLYLWMAQQYPSVQPLSRQTGFSGGQTDDVSLWRERLLQLLKERGTKEACRTLERIVLQTGEQDRPRMQQILLEAQTLARRRAWLPYHPAYLLKVIADSRVRLVQNTEQLLEVVIESLRRLEATFCDETPAWRDVWDRLPLTQSETPTAIRSRRHRAFTYRPVDENEFSDYVKRYLQADLGSRGIIANREVVIRPDERIDIRIDAVARRVQEEIDEQLTLIIEVKGCWNEELMTAMRTQLIDRYLRDNHCQHGLYLVGWFNCKTWDNQDYRKNKAPKMALEEAQHLFDEQAASLSQHVTVKALVLNAAVREREK